jgi:diguanylate cyclase (GGDEF)-like protein
VGDLLLIEAAHRISSCVREVDIVARFGGDEFVVILSELELNEAESTRQAGIVAEKIRAILDKPFLLRYKKEGQSETTIEHHCTASIGVIVFINHEESQDHILKWADAAMYLAKEAGGNTIKFYAPTDPAPRSSTP